MAKLVELQSNWKRGMKQDFPRTAMPDGSAWNIVDYIPDLDAPLTKRGGWSYGSNALYQPISAVNKINQSFASASSYVTNSWVPSANRLYLLAVVSYAGGTAPNIPTATGNGLTWVQVTTILNATNVRITVLRALVPSGQTTGATTVAFAGQSQTDCYIIIDEFANIDTTGTNGSGALVQSATNAGTSAASNVALNGFQNTNNAAYMATEMNTNTGITPKSGWTELAELAPTRSLETEYKAAVDTNPTASWTGSFAWAAIGAEIKNGLFPAAEYMAMVTYVPFSAGPRLMCQDSNGELFYINSGIAEDVGATGGVSKQSAFHANTLILPGGVSRKYTGGVLSVLTGAPDSTYATVYKDRTVLNSTANLTRIYFSAAGDPLTWDTTNGWLSVGDAVTGLAALPGALMVFQATRATRIRGSTPPPGTDMIADDPIFNIGCTDARSIAVTGAIAVFANPGGVYITNGTNTPTDLTRAVGIKRYWQSLLVNYDSATWTLAGGFYQNNYVISVMNGSTFVDAIMFNLEGYTAVRLANLQATSFANATFVSEKLWFGLRDEKRLGEYSTVFTPSATYKNDADGTAIAPILETPVYGANPPGVKSWRSIYIEYDCRDAASDNPTLTVSYAKNPGGAYTALTPTLVETTERGRKRINVRVPSDGLALKIAQSNASSLTRIYAIQADVHAREQSRV